MSLLYAGWDPHYEFQLYHSDPSGNYSGWKATCIGANNGTAQSLLKQEYKDDITMEAAISLVLRTMSKTMDSTTLGSEKRTCADDPPCSSASQQRYLTLALYSGICHLDAGQSDKIPSREDLQTIRNRRAPKEA